MFNEEYPNRLRVPLRMVLQGSPSGQGLPNGRRVTDQGLDALVTEVACQLAQVNCAELRKLEQAVQSEPDNAAAVLLVAATRRQQEIIQHTVPEAFG